MEGQEEEICAAMNTHASSMTVLSSSICSMSLSATKNFPGYHVTFVVQNSNVFVVELILEVVRHTFQQDHLEKRKGPLF